VKEHLGSSKSENSAERLADEVTRADVQIAQHVQQALDHRLGSLGSGGGLGEPVAPAAAVPTVNETTAAAQAVAGLFINPQNLRQAVLLKEILERPVDRW